MVNFDFDGTPWLRTTTKNPGLIPDVLMELRLFAQETPANPPRKDLEEVAGEKDVWTAFNCFSCHKYHADMQLENKRRRC